MTKAFSLERVSVPGVLVENSASIDSSLSTMTNELGQKWKHFRILYIKEGRKEEEEEDYNSTSWGLHVAHPIINRYLAQFIFFTLFWIKGQV